MQKMWIIKDIRDTPLLSLQPMRAYDGSPLYVDKLLHRKKKPLDVHIPITVGILWLLLVQHDREPF